MDFSNHLFRCSSLGYIMTEPRSKSEGGLSETCKVHLIDAFVSAKYDRQTDLSSRYLDKGNMCEEDSITLYSRVKKQFFKKNKEHLFNKYIKGTPDLFEGESIYNAHTIPDIKTSWDIYTFFRVHTQPLNKNYYWQLQGYMSLTGAKVGKLVYCLVNTPETLIQDEERKLFYRMNAGTIENKEYMAACEELRKNMIYDDIPIIDRVNEIIIDRNQADIEKIGDRVERCREYLNQLEQKVCPSLLVQVVDPAVKAVIVDKINVVA